MKAGVEKTYLREIMLQVEYALDAVQGMNKQLLPPGNTRRFFREAHSLLSHAAAVSHILWPPEAPEQDSQRIAAASGAYLREALGINEHNPLRCSALRDHLMPFDERLDHRSPGTSHGSIVDSSVGPTPHGRVPAVGPREFQRVYDTYRRCFTFRGEEFDIPNIVSALSTVWSRAAKRMSTLPEAMQSAPDTG